MGDEFKRFMKHRLLRAFYLNTKRHPLIKYTKNTCRGILFSKVSSTGIFHMISYRSSER